MRMNIIIPLLVICCIVSFAWQKVAIANNEKNKEPLKVGFIMVGPVSDLGWNYLHDQGRLYLESTMHGQVKTILAENIPESAEVERVMERMIAQGARLIFTTSYGYLEPASRIAARHPDVVIMQCQRHSPVSVKNMGTYFGRQFEPMYAAGVVAAHMTKTSRIGYIGGHPVPPLILGLNAFTLGARSIKPAIKVQAVWTNSWCDPAIEAEATKGLIDAGADIIVCHNDTALTVVKTCEKNGVFSMGCNADLKTLSSKSWLTGQTWNWGPLYVKIAQSIIDHTWRPANSIYGMKDGYVCLSAFGSAVPLSVQKEANSVRDKIIAGKLIVFKGPLKDRDGRERLHPDQTLDDKDLACVDWVVPGVEGPVPKGK